MKYITDEDKSYFRGLKGYILVIVLLYFVSFTSGALYAYYENMPYAPQASNNFSYNETEKHIVALFNNTYEKNNKDLEKFDDSTSTGMRANIFVVNTFISTFSISGVFFGILPVFSTALNGFIIGEFYYLLTLRLGLVFFLSYTLPHGIIEDAGIFLSMAIGLFLGWKMILIFRYMILDRTMKWTFGFTCSYIVNGIKNDFIKSVKFYIKYALPLILMASLIEVYITPIIGHAISGV